MRNNKFLFLIFSLCLSLSLFSQNTGTYVRLGTGISILGTGDVSLNQYNAEIHRNLNNYLSISSSFDIAHGFNNYYTPNVNFLKGSINSMLAPFGNHKRYSFEIGGGLSMIYLSKVRITKQRIVNGEIVETLYEHSMYRTFGVNINLDNSFRINDANVIVLRTFLNRSFEDLQIGLELKWGYKLN